MSAELPSFVLGNHLLFIRKIWFSFLWHWKMRLLLQKQRNRGQDGAGLATIKLNPKPGEKYISRKRSVATNYLDDLFDQVYYHFNKLKDYQQDAQWLKDNKPYMGELLLGHLRYGTHSDNSIETCHPFLRQNNWISRNLLLAGNFNLTNVDELFQELVELGQYPKENQIRLRSLKKLGTSWMMKCNAFIPGINPMGIQIYRLMILFMKIWIFNVCCEGPAKNLTAAMLWLVS